MLFAQQNTEKTANRNSKINFYFVTCFYSLCDICMADRKTCIFDMKTWRTGFHSVAEKEQRKRIATCWMRATSCRNKPRRLWRPAVATHPTNASRLSMSCGFRGAGPISWNPLQAAKQRSCGYVRTSTHIVPRRDTDASVIRNFVPVFCNGRLRGYGETP